MITQLWPTPLYIGNEKVPDNLLDYCKSVPYDRMNSKNGDMSIDKYVLDDLPDLKKKLALHCNTYLAKDLSVSKNSNFYFLNSWIVKHHKGDYAQSHLHTNSMISGVYYVNVPKDSGNIIFQKENTNIFYPNINVEFNEINTINSKEYTIDVEEGMVLLFPSWLLHSVLENLNDETRYSLAFNLFVKGEYGKDEFKLEIK